VIVQVNGEPTELEMLGRGLLGLPVYLAARACPASAWRVRST